MVSSWKSGSVLMSSLAGIDEVTLNSGLDMAGGSQTQPVRQTVLLENRNHGSRILAIPCKIKLGVRSV